MAKVETIFATPDKDGVMTTIAAVNEAGVRTVPGIIEIETDDMLKLLKKHVRADDFSDDDDYLQMLLDAAESYIITYTNRSKDELMAMGKGEMPRELVHAMMLISGHWYDHREAVTTGGTPMEVPYTYSALVKPFKKLV